MATPKIGMPVQYTTISPSGSASGGGKLTQAAIIVGGISGTTVNLYIFVDVLMDGFSSVQEVTSVPEDPTQTTNRSWAAI